jgi:heterocyst specific transport system permease protein
MLSPGRLAWLQLRREKVRLAVALAGVAFASLLMLMQLGFQDALFRSAVQVHAHLNGDIVLVNPHWSFLAAPKTFPRRRLYQALAVDGVDAVSSVYTMIGRWQNPETGGTRDIFVLGIDPDFPALDIPAVAAQQQLVRYPDVALWDELGRTEYGPIPAVVRERGEATAELNAHAVTVRGLFRLGTSFGVDGTLLTSDLNLRRMFPARSLGAVTIGLVRLRRGAEAVAVRRAIAAALPEDVVVLTKDEFMAREIGYWQTSTPIGFVFSFGVVMGLVVGAIIVYQILFADISDHLAEYATLKALGYTNRYLVGVVFMEASVLAVIGFLPGLAISSWVYRLTRDATMLPLEVTGARTAIVLAMTLAMCWASSLIAVRKLRAADPADVF